MILSTKVILCTDLISLSMSEVRAITRSGEETETEFLSIPVETRAIGLSETRNGDCFEDDDGVVFLADISGDEVFEDRDKDGVWRTEDDCDGVTSSRGWSPFMTEAAARTLGARLASLQDTWPWKMRSRMRALASESITRSVRTLPTF